MSTIEKAIWLSYDLGIGGDYPGLYKWLDNHKAIECGNSVAFFSYKIANNKLNQLPEVVYNDIIKNVNLRAGDRLYIIRREVEESSTLIKGSFIFGRRKSNPWDGYGDVSSVGSEDGQ